MAYGLDVFQKGNMFWGECQAVLPKLLDSHSYGKIVPEATTTLIQHRLASTVPPRPIVSLGFEAAVGELGRFCGQGQLIQNVLQCRSSSDVFVSGGGLGRPRVDIDYF
jgi:N-alpha-acetyltransferase 35, NatC auxiliary subunit